MTIVRAPNEFDTPVVGGVGMAIAWAGKPRATPSARPGDLSHIAQQFALGSGCRQNDA
jgi:hypothetical protein